MFELAEELIAIECPTAETTAARNGSLKTVD
jgi:hypothetical protein